MITNGDGDGSRHPRVVGVGGVRERLVGWVVVGAGKGRCGRGGRRGWW